MSQILERLYYSKMGKSVLNAVGVKQPLELKRYHSEVPWVAETLGLAGEPSDALKVVLRNMDCKYEIVAQTENKRFSSLLMDASDFETIDELERLKSSFAVFSSQIQKTGHIVILGKTPDTCESIEQASTMESLNGFTRALAKEFGRKAITVNLIYLPSAPGLSLSTPLAFLLSNKATYVSGQPLYLNDHEPQPVAIDWTSPLKGKLALVTGAAQGIGAAIAKTLARDGATVIGLDIPHASESLKQAMSTIQGIPLTTDITSDQAVADIIAATNGKPLDIVVHNAGVTRDKTLSKMPDHWWQMTMNINLKAPIRVTEGLELAGTLADDARIICISSISGIAGNVGQTNYSASKSGVIGFIRKQAAHWQDTNKTINAIAPGFIETQMTDEIPFMTREIGRRMNSLSQGGKPQDVAEGVALFAQPGASALNGQVLRVCGQSLIGA